MMSSLSKQLTAEIRQTPPEYLPFLLNIVHTFRESVSLKSAEESFKQGWQDIQNENTQPLSKLWDNI